MNAGARVVSLGLVASGLLTSHRSAFAAPEEPAPANQAPAVPGFGFTSEDREDSLFIHWLVQADGYGYAGQKPPGVASRSTFTLGFAGLQLDATLRGVWHSSVLVDYSESRLTLLDAFVEGRFARAFIVRVGKFETPLSEERLTPKFLLPWISTGDVSRQAFTHELASAPSMDRANVFGAGVNWYPINGFGVLLDYSLSTFSAYGAAPTRPAESTIYGRCEFHM